MTTRTLDLDQLRLAPSRAVVIDIEDTVFLHPAGPPTVRIVPPSRRLDAVGEARIRIPRTIGVVDSPLDTGQLPPLAAYAVRPRPVSHRRRAGSHRRAVQPGLVARLWALFGFGRRDGA